ncbi:MAG: bifunctional phosphopantothenoylcysteine decarboxylase/phosphopantothenate--cysteine ligase CoaBC [Thermoplasmata archaeon]
MHPSRAIRGRTSRLLEGRRIVLGIAGSIAAIEAPRIARELLRHGAEVVAVMTPDARRIITPEAMEFATGHPPVTELTGGVEHVALLGPGEGRADLLLIAPATANTIGKIAHGIDDTPVTSCASVALGGGIPILLAPAMHADMHRNPAVQASLEALRRWGVGFVPTVSAEGEEKLAPPEAIAAAVLHRLARGPWSGRTVVVIGGAAREPIDHVRSLTNESSGAMAVSLAAQAHYRGAMVELWMGHHTVPLPPYLEVHPWRTVGDLVALAERRKEALARASLVIVPAALADYTVSPADGKISSRDHPTLQLSLVRAAKVLPTLRRLAPRPCLLVGFKLEATSDEGSLAGAAARLADEADLDGVVANGAGTMGSPAIHALVVSRTGERHWLTGAKEEVAGKLLDDLGRSPLPAPPRAATPARPSRPSAVLRRSARRRRRR